ncbi:sperm microtubule associated protein 2 [Pelodytes ibericus]
MGTEKEHGGQKHGPSKRQEELAKPKSVHIDYKQDRPTALWPIKASSLQAIPSPRIKQLAEAKHVSLEWQEARPVYSIVSEGAKTASASLRILELAKSKQCMSSFPSSTLKTHQEEGDGCIRSEKLVAPTSRTEALAVPKGVHPHFQHDLPTQRKVPAVVLHAQASDRVSQLAKPKLRKAIYEGYDPYRISPAAKTVDASPRTLELSTPPARRQRAKKI